MTDELEIQHRSLELRAEDLADNGDLRLLCSTDDAVNVGEYREILVHTRESIELGSCRSLLLNHDPDQIVGGIRSTEVREGKLYATAFVVESAKTAAGTSVRELIKAGALRGVSIGYVRDMASASYDERSNTLTVPKWAVREITLTPTPADTRAQVLRSLPSQFQVTRSATNSDCTTIAAPAAPQKEGSHMAADDIKPQGDKTPDAAPKIADELAQLRQERANDLRITKLAESHGLRASDFLGKPVDVAIEAMLESKANADKVEVKGRSADIQVGKSQLEKSNEEAVAALVSGSNSGLSVAARHARAAGLDTSEWNRSDIAAYLLAKPVLGMRASPAHVTSSNFNTVVLANYMDKAVQAGFGAGETTYQLWTNRRVVSDFKTFASGALDSGNLVSTAENLAFPELTKAESSFTGALGLYGATITLTMQALVNDDLGEFTRMLNRAGAVAARTIDKLVITTLEAMTWTGNITTASALGTSGSLDTVRAAFANKTGPGGEKLGNVPKFLLAPPTLRRAALGETTALYAGTTSNGTNGDIQPIIGAHLAQAATPAQSLYYLIANPSMVDTVTVAFLSGAESPQVMEYDAGAVAARKWKIIQAVTAVGATSTVAGTVYTPGIQQGSGAA